MSTIKLPKYVLAKPSAHGTAYYWNLPSWARKRDAVERDKGKDGSPCPVGNEALPSDLPRMLQRAEELNQSLDGWRRGEQTGPIRKGSFAWLVRWFQKSAAYLKTGARTREGYDEGLALIETHALDDGLGPVGDVMAKALEPYHADEIYDRLRKTGRKGDRTATANAAMRAARRMFNVALRKKLVAQNPFAKMELAGTGGTTRPAERQEVAAFIAAADEIGMPAMGTAALIAFELCQREGDVLAFAWNRYRPGLEIKIRQLKTDEMVWATLRDEEGELFPGLIDRLATTPRRGPVVLMRDRPERNGQFKPYNEDLFRKHFRKVRQAAKLPSDFTMMSCRHGGLTELGDAEATDQEMMAVSGHQTRQTLTVYARRTRKQALNAARKRRALRTQTGQKSE